MLELKSGAAVLRLLPEVGGAVASWTQSGIDILHRVSDPKLIAQHGQPVGAYPLIPFSNRVGYGRFSFGGESFQLAPNFAGEPNTIHGNAWERAWTVREAAASGAVLVLDHQGPAAQWPFTYRVSLTTSLSASLGETELAIAIRFENTDARAQPVGFGVHPFFPNDGQAELRFDATSVWKTDANSLPETRLPVQGDWSFAATRRVQNTDLDNGYAGWSGEAVLLWPEQRRGIRITASDLFAHLVVFSPPGKPYFAVEPASNMSNAVNHLALADNGLRVVPAGGVLEGWVRITLFTP